jgi:arylsulfatase
MTHESAARPAKMSLYETERDWWSTPNKLGVPKLFNLIKDPTEEYGATGQ